MCLTWAEGFHCITCGAWIPSGHTHHCAGTTSVPPTFIPIQNPVVTPLPATTTTLVFFSQEDRDRLLRIEEKLDLLLAAPRPRRAAAQRRAA